ncbi:hypothetical protein DSO57_1007638 [Entomophthora muscae]|uniref:Uncharacterized protein n=1 Tax=Entomophthora muscae TaxID=34485 RepID=A0ACC2SKB2_9FUNG|nr:hypothetical protein DSO57_1007638 [Entomophthora muscae]
MKSFIALVVLASIAFECESKGIRFPLRRFPKYFLSPRQFLSTLPTAQQHLKAHHSLEIPKAPLLVEHRKRRKQPQPVFEIQPRNQRAKIYQYEDDEIPTGDDSPDEEAEAEDKPESPIEDVVAGAKKDGAESTEDSSDMEREYSGLD